MSLFVEKFKEVLLTLLPVVVIVLLLTFTIVDVSSDITIRFLVGAAMLLVGLAIFLFGVDMSISPIGEYMSEEVATSKAIIKILFLSFLLGFLITVAEPDLLILGHQIENAWGGSLGSALIVWVVSFGVGIMISLGILNLLKGQPMNRFMAVVYGVIFALALFVSEEFLAISFDASGATTGALTTPFILALSLGLSKMIGGRKAEENSFGLVGIMSSGPILAILLLSIITRQRNIVGQADPFIIQEGIFGPILKMLPSTFIEALLALLPITILFFIFNFRKFKVNQTELTKIIKGLIYLLIGLTLFLTGVNSGFMDMGRIIGMQLAVMNGWFLIGVAFILGLIVVLVEPAVHVLGQQIEEVTSGAIPMNIIRTTLSIGVGIAIALSMVRIVVPEVKLGYFLFPGFLIAIILSFRVDPIFVGIAYDAGGVASGPMTATFVLAFAQGAADVIPTADVLVDGFGVIAMVAMTPILSIMILGMIFKRQEVVDSRIDMDELLEADVFVDDEIAYDNIMVIVNRGYSEQVIALAREQGATGATIINARGTSEGQEVRVPLLNIELQPEKEIIIFVTTAKTSVIVADYLIHNYELVHDADMVIYLAPVDISVDTFVKNGD